MEALFVSAGLSEEKAKQTIKNNELSTFLNQSLLKVKEIAPITRDNGLHVYNFCTKLVNIDQTRLLCNFRSKKKELVDYILPYIARGDLDSGAKVEAAIEYGQKSPEFEKSEFESSCGVGLVVTNEQIENVVQAVIKENKEQIVKQRYRFNIGMLLGKARTRIPFVDGQKLKNALDLEILELLGPKTDKDLTKPKKDKKVKNPKKNEEKSEEHSESLEEQLKGYL